MHATTPSRQLLALTLLAGLALAPDVHAREAKAKAKPAVHEVVELELRDGTSDEARELLVPLHGDLSGSVELFGEPRMCRAKSSPTRDELYEIEIVCRTDRNEPVFELRSERVLALDRAIVLGELELREGQRLRVTATRR